MTQVTKTNACKRNKDDLIITAEPESPFCLITLLRLRMGKKNVNYCGQCKASYGTGRNRILPVLLLGANGSMVENIKATNHCFGWCLGVPKGPRCCKCCSRINLSPQWRKAKKPVRVSMWVLVRKKRARHRQTSHARARGTHDNKSKTANKTLLAAVTISTKPRCRYFRTTKQ